MPRKWLARPPVLMFSARFPEGAFIWDELLLHFARPKTAATTAWRPTCVALAVQQPQADRAYRAKHLVQDLVALISAVNAHGDRGVPGRARLGWRRGLEPGQPAAPAMAQAPGGHQLAPPGRVFARTVQQRSSQQASQYMHFCADQTQNRSWPKTTFSGCSLSSTPGRPRAPAWLTEAVRAQYRALWARG